MDDLLFDVDFFIDSSTGLIGLTAHTLQKKFVDAILQKAKDVKANKIITNGNLASVIQDYAGYYHSSSIPLKTYYNIYPMGKIGDISIFVDQYQRWDHNYIYFENDDKKLVRELKIKAINNTITEEDKLRIGRVYSGLVKDTNGILF